MGPLDQDIVAAVDLGSNSFHMVIARDVEGQPVVIDRLRERVALAEGLRPNGTLAPKVQTRALRCLERFGQRLSEVADSRCRAVGTATFRKARGAEDFHSLAEHALGREIEILGGREEARLIYLGVSHTLPGGSEKRLVIDIGGASTECIVGQRFESLLEESLAMGCVTFTRRFFPEGRLTGKAFKRARLEAELQLEPIEAAYERAGWEVAVGSSGTITAVASILEQQGWTRGGVTRTGLESLRASLLESESVNRIELRGLKADRRPVLAAGVAILEGLFRTFGIETLECVAFRFHPGLLVHRLGRGVPVDDRLGHRPRDPDLTAKSLLDRAIADPIQLRPEVLNEREDGGSLIIGEVLESKGRADRVLRPADPHLLPEGATSNLRPESFAERR